MPRSLQEIIDQAEQLAVRFESHDPDLGEVKDAAALRAVRQAAHARAQAEAVLADAVSLARAHGHAWATVGAMLGTSGEAARQRTTKTPRCSPADPYPLPRLSRRTRVSTCREPSTPSERAGSCA